MNIPVRSISTRNLIAWLPHLRALSRPKPHGMPTQRNVQWRRLAGRPYTYAVSNPQFSSMQGHTCPSSATMGATNQKHIQSA
jgi:hypothetical protein